MNKSLLLFANRDWWPCNAIEMPPFSDTLMEAFGAASIFGRKTSPTISRHSFGNLPSSKSTPSPPPPRYDASIFKNCREFVTPVALSVNECALCIAELRRHDHEFLRTFALDSHAELANVVLWQSMHCLNFTHVHPSRTLVASLLLI